MTVFVVGDGAVCLLFLLSAFQICAFRIISISLLLPLHYLSLFFFSTYILTERG